MADHSQLSIQAAAKLAFFNCASKQRLVNLCCLAARQNNQSLDKVQMTLEDAARAAWLHPQDLLLLLKPDPCFRLASSQGAACMVSVNTSALLTKARGATSTGILTEELPAPRGFVNGLHPIRPGQPNCSHDVKFGVCAYNERCVFNHPESTGAKAPSTAAQHQQPEVIGFRHVASAQQQHNSHSNAGHTSATGSQQHTQPSTPSSSTSVPRTPGSISDAGGPAWTAAPWTHIQQQVQQTQQQPRPPPPPQVQPTQQPSPPPPPPQVQQTQQQPPPPPPQPKPPQPQSQPVAVQDQGQPQASSALQQQPGVVVHPPGFSAEQYKARPCQMILLRGFCARGDKCPYDHTYGAAPLQPSSTAAAAMPPVSAVNIPAAAPSSNGHEQQAVSPLLASAEPATPGLGVDAPAATALPAVPAAWRPLQTPVATTPVVTVTSAAGAADVPTPAPTHEAQYPSAGEASSSSSSGNPVPHRSWKELVSGEAQEPASPAAAAGATHGAANAGAELTPGDATAPTTLAPDCARKLMGWTDGNLPQLRGAACCPFFMGTGTCRFKEQCVYHHPSDAMHPVCILSGELPRRYDTKRLPSFSRLVSHLYRIWDYDSCVEAQLKIWLAKHLLGRNNPRQHMFSSSAALPVLPSNARGFYWQSIGPYSCSMGEAGELLHRVWREQPDAAAQQPMPYTKKLRELLSGDPFFDVVVDKHKCSHYWVKLNVAKITTMLNF